MSWELIETGSVNRLPLDLYRSGEDFMIRVDGLELMNSRWTRSERALTELAGVEPRARILIGGLGLGFTLAAFVDKFPHARITVAEASADVLRWHERYFRALHGLDDSRVEFIHADVGDVLHGAFDLIVLDVDNGPEAVSGENNARLYAAVGLRALRRSLVANGKILLWSAFEAPAFAAEASAAGFVVERHPILVGLREHTHSIYALS